MFMRLTPREENDNLEMFNGSRGQIYASEIIIRVLQ